MFKWLIRKKRINNAYFVYADVKTYGLDNVSHINAVFKYKENAEKYGRMMWGKYFIIQPTYSAHFEG